MDFDFIKFPPDSDKYLKRVTDKICHWFVLTGKSNYYCPSTLLNLHSEEVDLIGLAGPTKACSGPSGEPLTRRPEADPLRDLLGGQQVDPTHYAQPGTHQWAHAHCGQREGLPPEWQEQPAGLGKELFPYLRP